MQFNKANKVILVILIIAVCAAVISCSAKPPEAAAANTEQSTPTPTVSAPAQSTPTPTAAPIAAVPTPTPEAAATTPAPVQGMVTPTPAPVKDTVAPTPTLEATVQPTAAPAAPVSNFKGVLTSPIAEQPAYLTSIGQSADVQMVKTLLTRAGIKFDFNSIAKPDEVSGKTLVLAVGGSSKGLGAAGIKAEDELARAAEIIKAAKAKKMTIISIHVGGEARRGELSDKFITEVVPYSDYIIVVEDGNKDGMFQKLANGIPIDTVKKITAVVDPLKTAFK